MALSGLLVTCCQVGTINGASLPDVLYWSEPLPVAGITTKLAPKEPVSGGGQRGMSFELTAAVDAYVAYGDTPNASTGARVFLKGGETRNVICREGDRVAWIAA